MKISSKIVMTFAPLAVVSLATVGWLGYDTAREVLKRQALDSLQSLADLQQRRIEDIVAQNAERLALVASRTQLRISLKEYLRNGTPASLEKMTRILRDARETIPDFRELFVQVDDGRIVASTDSTMHDGAHPDHAVFAEATEERGVHLFHRKPGGGLGVYLAAPLRLDGERLGVLVIDADGTNIVASTTSYGGLGRTGETLLVRRHADGGAVFLTPARFDPDATLTRTVAPHMQRSPYIQVLDDRSGLMTDAVDYRGRPVLAALRSIAGPGWGLVVQKQVEEAFAPVQRLRTWTVMLLAAFSAAVVVVSLFMARSITRPIMQLTKVADRISRGALHERADIGSRDEVQQLSRAFNQMTEQLVADIDERRQAEEKFHALLTSAPDAILITRSGGEIELANRRAEDLLNRRGEAAVGFQVEELLPQRYRQQYRALRRGFITRPETRSIPVSIELSVLDSQGTEVPVEVSIAPIETKEGLLFVNAIRDISDRKQAEAKLVQQANYDNLTGLPSRILAADRLSQALARSHRTGSVGALMFLDVDRFKNVNDTMGHSVGDELLAEVAARLLSCVRESDTVARLGGDEFLVVLNDLRDIAAADVVAEQMLSALSEPIQLGSREVFISASIGITAFPIDSNDPDVLLRNADAAMYRAKEEGRNTYRFFTAEMNEQLRMRLEMEQQLRHAVERGELYLHFQPQLDVKRGELLGAEALLRWRNARLGQIGPDRFIPLAEETGLIDSIGAWVLKQACAEAAAWEGDVGRRARIAVNVSALQFKRGDLDQVVARTLEETGLPAHRLELELTERVLVDQDMNAKRTLAALKDMGVRLSLDDFGTGYSSLSYLKWFPCDVLKIDRAFISGVTDNKDSASLCRAIIAMGGSLNMIVVAEGVETAEQLAFLAAHGVDAVQGYYISRPMEASAFRRMLARPESMRVLYER